MDLVNALQSVPGIGPYLPYIVAVIAVAAIIMPYLPVPAKKSGFYFAVWTFLNILAQHHANAKVAVKPGSEEAVRRALKRKFRR